MKDNTILLPQDLQDNLQQTLSRLSDREKQILSVLASENNGISLAKLLENAKITPSDLVNVLQSLLRRCFLEQQANAYILSDVLRQYIL